MKLKKNGSPVPEFETDDERNYLITTINMHKDFKIRKVMSESMSVSMTELEYTRLKAIISNLEKAGLLDVKRKTASRLLARAVELKILKCIGKTKDKVYFIN